MIQGGGFNVHIYALTMFVFWSYATDWICWYAGFPLTLGQFAGPAFEYIAYKLQELSLHCSNIFKFYWHSLSISESIRALNFPFGSWTTWETEESPDLDSKYVLCRAYDRNPIWEDLVPPFPDLTALSCIEKNALWSPLWNWFNLYYINQLAM